MSGVILSVVSDDDDPTRHWQLGTASMATYCENDLTNKVYIASGGFGDVCKYRNRKLGHDIIVKTCKGESDQEQKNLIDEATKHFRTGATHMNIVRVLGLVILNDDVPGFILEYMDEGSLHTVISEAVKSTNGKGHYVYSRANIVSWCADIASALYFVHAQNLKHLDLKPLNVLMWRHRTSVKVSDFGISKFHNKTTTDVSAMTYDYAAPEMFDGHSSTLSDIYSFAIVLWAMIHRRKPYSDKNGNHHNMGCMVFLSKVTNGLRPEIDASANDELFRIMRSCWSPIERRWDAHTLLESLVDMRDTMTQMNSPPFICDTATTLTFPLSLDEQTVGVDDDDDNTVSEETVKWMGATFVGSPTGTTIIANKVAGNAATTSSTDSEIEKLREWLTTEKTQKDTFQATCRELTEKLKISQQQTTDVRTQYKDKLRALEETHKKAMKRMQDQLNQTTKANQSAPAKDTDPPKRTSTNSTTEVKVGMVPPTSPYSMINIRVEPSLEAPRWGALPKGAWFSFIQKVSTSDGDWVKLSVQSIAKYCSTDLLPSGFSNAWCLVHDKKKDEQLLVLE